MAGIAHVQGDYEKALNYLKQVLKNDREIRDKSGEGTTLNNIGQLYFGQGDYERALSYLEQSLLIQKEIGDRSIEGITLNNISQIHYARGDYERALSYLEQSLTITKEIGQKAKEVVILHNMALISLITGKVEKATQYWSEAFPIAMKTQNADILFEIASKLGVLFVKIGNRSEAKKLLTIAVQVGKQAGFPDVDQIEKLLREVEET